MAANSMLSWVVNLDVQPGDIPPMINLKQGTNSATLLFKIAADGITMATDGKAVMRAEKPDGTEVIEVLDIEEINESYVNVVFTSDQVEELTDIAGKFLTTITIIDTDDDITAETYEYYEVLTFQQFYMNIQEMAYTGE